MERLQNALKVLVEFNDDELEVISKLIEPIQLHKGDFFSNPEKTCNILGFLNNGILRVYHLNDGKEVTDYFNTTDRNPFVSSFASFLNRRPSRQYVEALTDVEVLTISYTNLQNLYDSSKKFERIGRLLAEKNYLLNLERIESLQYHDATKRYLSFLQLYPNLVNEIQNHYIASYLGVTAESLSRIRRNLTK